MARYGVPSDNALGVTMADMKVLAKQLGKNHELAAALWATEVYEARMVTSFVDEPSRVTPSQMDRWCRDFDNWGICDTVCFKLFDQVPHAPSKVAEWTALNDEFGRRAGFALLACLALHGKAAEADLIGGLALIEACATDERNFVRKGVNWALRAIGGKTSPLLRAAARETAAKLAASTNKTARWNGRDAVRAFAKADAKGAASQ
ncbi:MAG: alkylation repair enzyme [Phenylobacterium sp.]|nr:alkylation repair enzyme [Phenylobacterium sp.]